MFEAKWRGKLANWRDLKQPAWLAKIYFAIDAVSACLDSMRQYGSLYPLPLATPNPYPNGCNARNIEFEISSSKYRVRNIDFVTDYLLHIHFLNRSHEGLFVGGLCLLDRSFPVVGMLWKGIFSNRHSELVWWIIVWHIWTSWQKYTCVVYFLLRPAVEMGAQVTRPNSGHMQHWRYQYPTSVHVMSPNIGRVKIHYFFH